jgi:hypothetical protein
MDIKHRSFLFKTNVKMKLKTIILVHLVLSTKDYSSPLFFQIIFPNVRRVDKEVQLTEIRNFNKNGTQFDCFIHEGKFHIDFCRNSDA